MAASTANQKVFVPLTGVLKLQDYIRQSERVIENTPDSTLKSVYKARHNELAKAVEYLELPIEVRHYNG